MSDNEKQLFENLALEHMDNIYSNAIRLAKSTKNAETLVHHTFQSAFERFEQFDKNHDFKEWLNRILVHIHVHGLSTHQQGERAR